MSVGEVIIINTDVRILSPQESQDLHTRLDLAAADVRYRDTLRFDDGEYTVTRVRRQPRPMIVCTNGVRTRLCAIHRVLRGTVGHYRDGKRLNRMAFGLLL